MTNWTDRAKSEILETVGGGTDKTSETRLSSVSSAPPWAVYRKNDGVSSVSSVGVRAVSEKCDFQNITDALLKAAMRVCDKHGDSKAAREAMRRECLVLSPHLQSDLLDHFNQTYSESKT